MAQDTCAATRDPASWQAAAIRTLLRRVNSLERTLEKFSNTQVELPVGTQQGRTLLRLAALVPPPFAPGVWGCGEQAAECENDTLGGLSGKATVGNECENDQLGMLVGVGNGCENAALCEVATGNACESPTSGSHDDAVVGAAREIQASGERIDADDSSGDPDVGGATVDNECENAQLGEDPWLRVSVDNESGEEDDVVEEELTLDEVEAAVAPVVASGEDGCSSPGDAGPAGSVAASDAGSPRQCASDSAAACQQLDRIIQIAPRVSSCRPVRIWISSRSRS